MIDRIRKLLALANSSNAHEAAAAAAMASRLMERHDVDRSMIEEADDTPYEPVVVDRTIYRMGGRRKVWVGTIAHYLGQVRRCRVWSSWEDGEQVLRCAGATETVDSVELLLNWLVGEVERLIKQDRPDGLGRGGSRRWAHSYRLGAAVEIGNRLQEAAELERKRLTMSREERYALALEEGDAEAMVELDKDEAIGTSYALARVDTALARLDLEKQAADAWVAANLKLKSTRGSRATSTAGYAAGRKAGRRANLTGRLIK